jgi:hypothetical protein
VSIRNCQGATGNGFPVLNLSNSAGTYASPTILPNSQYVGRIAFHTYESGGGSTELVDISAYAESSFATNHYDTALIFATNSTTTLAERMRITSTGSVRIAGLTASKVVVSDVNKGLASGTNTDAEIAGAVSHKSTEDAINGLVFCNGAGTYSAKVIGTDVQAHNAGLSDIAGLAVTDSNIIVGDGTHWVAESGATARTSLGLGTGDNPTFTSIALTGTSNPTLRIGPTDTSSNFSVSVVRSGTFNVPGFGTYGNGASDVAYFYLFRGRGATGNIGHVLSGDILGSVRFAGMYGASDPVSAGSVTSGAGITGVANEDWVASNHTSSYMTFGCTPVLGSAGPVEYMRLDSTGRLLVNKTSGTEKLEVNGKIRADSVFNCNGTDGVTGTFVDNNGNTVQVTGGIITDLIV